ncbi:hypothetical protein GLOIN_2v1773372 [Rhizophagus clarus]|uniref:Uncharacterized protein n=1 Tax=Rhizophagus clarus TaxID=94130 RepID=A0A8H3QS30_9GLOM|nr:hypothetical protein GLOIN_2v1773372 [Rhizophagus clarus]
MSITLVCLIKGNSLAHAFAVDIESNKLVDIPLKEENDKLIAVNTKINYIIQDELEGVELTPTSKISKHFSFQPVDEHINIIVQRPVETKEIHCSRGKAKKFIKHRLSVTQYVRQQLPHNTLKAKNFYIYFNYSTLSEGKEVLKKTLETLNNDPELGNLARGCLKRDEFFESDKVKLYFERKKRKDKEKIGAETTLSMASERLSIANEISHQNSLDCLKKIAEKVYLSDEESEIEEEDEDEPQQDRSSSNMPPVDVENCGSTQIKSLPCYLDGLPIHAEYSCMEEDWIINDVILSNNLKGTGIIRRGHFNFSDTGCTSQISDEHWENVLIPFLTRHKLKNALSIEDDEKKLVEMFGEENKQKLLEQGNLKLIVSLCDNEEDTSEVLEMVKRIRLVLYLKEFVDCQTLKSLEMKWATSIPSDILDKHLRDILWAAELIKWVIVQWQDGTFLKEMKEPWVKTQLTSRLLLPVIPVKPGETESDAEKIVANSKKPLLSPKIKAKIRVDGLDNTEEFENVWVELKGGVGTRHESENSNNLEDLDVLLKGFSVMSAMQALTIPEEAKKKICELEFFGIRGIGNHFQFWGCLQTSKYLMCSYLLGEFYLPSFEGREGSGLQELLYAIRIVYSFKTRVETSKLAFHQIRSSARIFLEKIFVICLVFCLLTVYADVL